MKANLSAAPQADPSAVAALVSAASAADAVDPLNEEALFFVAERPCILATVDGELVGYAQFGPGTAQLVVHPDHRAQGIGTAILTLALEHGPSSEWWAFGDLPAARALAARFDLHPSRVLLQMSRDLAAAPPADPETDLAVDIRGFRPGDEDAWLALNSTAFADHPEQGSLTRGDLDRRLAADWFDPEGLLMAWEMGGTALLGFHWTKVHDETTGEVYVIAVSPAVSGQGLGRVLLEAGLRHLRDRGVRTVILYVEGSNARVVTLYETSGFLVSHRDVLYTHRDTSHE